MNIIGSHKTLVRLWAAVYCDFESVLAKFMGSKGWRYAHFAKVCRETRITLIMHITQARGKSKDEHYDRITDMILQLSKELWLRAGHVTSRRGKVRKMTAVNKTMELKRSMGGFFLLYTMFERQPIHDRVKISLDVVDMKALNKFCEAVGDVPFRSEIHFMLNYLMHKKAFHFCAYSTEFRFDLTTRNFLNSSQSEAVNLTRRVRGVQDVLAYSSIHSKVESALAELAAVKYDLARDLLKTVDIQNLSEHIRNATAFNIFGRTITSERLEPALNKLDGIIDKPVMTLQSLTATEAIERRMMMETRKRMERARKKALQNNDRDRDGKQARPYVREGGIFGRKKEIDTDDKCKRRERGACSGNLWVYINGYDFDKPITGDPSNSVGQPDPDQDDDDDDMFMDED